MPPRVISLLPSATEVLCAIGGGDLLVGRSHECDWPPSVKALPALSAQRIHETDPAKIDALVREQLKEPGSSLYTIDRDAIAAFKPDLILTQDLCHVCSIDLASVQQLAASLPSKPQVLSLNPHTVEDILDDHLRVGEAVGMVEEARGCVVRLRERLFAAGEFVNPFDDGPNVALLEWTDPLFIGGHWSVQLVERAGGWHPLNATQVKPELGAAAGPQHGERRAGASIRIPDEILAASKPEYIVIAPCGFDLAATRKAAMDLSRKPWWKDLPAVRNRRVALVDGNQFFNRPGPRIVDAYECLVGWLNQRPSLAPEGFAWELM